MLKYYFCVYHNYYKGKKISSTVGGYCIDENRESTKIKITWDNIENYLSKLQVDCRETKKGKKLYFFESLKAVKEWKEKNLEMELEIEYREIEPSIQQILNFSDCKKAIQYLKER